MSVKGFWALRLDDYVRGANPDAILTMTEGWDGGREAFNGAGTTMDKNATKASNGFSETMASGAAMKSSLLDSSKFAHEKRDKIRDAEDALGVVQLRLSEAIVAKAQIDHDLPDSHPSVNPADYPTDAKQVGKRQAEANDTALAQAKADYAAREAAIADAERKAAAKVQAVDAAVIEADPKVRALVDPDNTREERPSGSPAVRGSYSDVAAARARMAKYNSGTLYPDGWGHDLIAQEKANIAGYEAENRPEWNGTEWINADGSPAPSTSYAMVETADGLAPLSGGAGGATALALGAGGALLGAGVAKAIASKFGARASAKTATAGGTSRSAAARSAAARAGAAGARAGAGAGARGAGARGTGAGGRGTGAGGRGTAGGRAGARGGAGAAGGRGAKKRDQNGSQNQEWEADYTDDWTESASDVLDPNASRGWVPKASDSNDDDKKRR